MPLLIVLFALLMPRLIIALLWLLTAWFQGMFANPALPILGFILLPTTLLWYSVVHNWMGGQWDIVGLVGLVVAVLLDIGPVARRRRAAEA